MEESEEGINGIDWNTLLQEHSVDGNYIYGYVTSEAGVHTVLELHKRATTTTFCVRQSSSLQFSPTKVDKEKVRFSPRSIFYSKSSSPRIPDDGVPFLFGGWKILECQFGPVRIRQRKREKKREASDVSPGGDNNNNNNNGSVLDHNYAPPPPSPSTAATDDRRRYPTQDTRKKGCEAKIAVKQICRFPQYAVSCQKNHAREQTKTKERLLKDLREGKEVDVENRYYLELPLNRAHTKHTLGGVYGMAQTVHPTITRWIEQLVGEGVTDSQEIQATLRHYVKTRMSDAAAPSELDRAYYPRLKDVKNHVYLAKVRLRIARPGRGSLRQTVEERRTGGTYVRPHRNRKRAAVSADGVGGDPSDVGVDSPAEDARESDDSGDVYGDAMSRIQGHGPPEPAALRSRRRACEALDALRAMTCSCTNSPALEALTAGIEALALTFRNLLDEPPDGPAQPTETGPHSCRGRRNDPGTETASLPLVRSTSSDDYSYGGWCGATAAAADAARLAARRKAGGTQKRAKRDPCEEDSVDEEIIETIVT